MSYYNHDGQVADFIFANETGTRRREVVASEISALNVDTSAGQQIGSKVRTVSFQFPAPIRTKNDRNTTNTLVNKDTLSHILLPAGVRLTNVVAVANAGASVDNKLKIALGRSCPLIKNKENKIALAGSLVSFKAPLSGEILSVHRSQEIPAALNGVAAAELVAIYNADAEAEGEELINISGYEAVQGFVGEPRPFYLCATVLEGTISDVKDISINVTYVLPAEL
jgi:hypothetical protein